MRFSQKAKRNSRAGRRAVTLNEVIFVVMSLGFALALVSRVFWTHLEVNRRLTASATRAAAAQSFLHQLRTDLLVATSFKVTASAADAPTKMTTVVINSPAGATSYVFETDKRNDADGDREAGIDQIVVRTDAGGTEHRWVLPAQTVNVLASATAPARVLILRFEDNGPLSAGFNRRESLEVSLLSGGER